jgi:hypothetical protein
LIYLLPHTHSDYPNGFFIVGDHPRGHGMTRLPIRKNQRNDDTSFIELISDILIIVFYKFFARPSRGDE